MDKNKELRLFTASIIVDSKLSKAAKLQLLNFIKEEASDVQVKALLLDGKIVTLDEQAEEIVNARFKQSSLNEIDPMAIVLTVGIAGFTVLISKALWITWRVVKATFSEKAAKCGALTTGVTRKACYAQLDIYKAEQTIKLLNKQISVCSKAKNPKKCIDKTKKIILKLKGDIQKAKQKLQKLTIKKPQKAASGIERARKTKDGMLSTSAN